MKLEMLLLAEGPKRKENQSVSRPVSRPSSALPLPGKVCTVCIPQMVTHHRISGNAEEIIILFFIFPPSSAEQGMERDDG
jgi:hypothetical protein